APESVELAILHKRAGQWEDAHQVFASVEAELRNDARGLHEYAQTKVKLASKLPKTMGLKRDRLNREAAEMLRQVVRLNDSPTRTAWAWFDLAKTLESLRAPASEIEQACVKAIELLPTEQRFQDWRAFRNADPGHE
ncbi:MAG: hypothetical protein NT069_24215, partial [Planctomycetota bacterium]|nr:hypothetical protein [Planctomycetota bacterium]